MRTMATQRPNYDVGYDEFLPHDVEYSLSKVIDREISFYLNTDYQKYTLSNRYDYSHLEAFSCIDRFNSNRIDYDNLKSFFRDLAMFPYDEELIAILRRVDRDDDGVIKYDEFVEALDTIDQDLKQDQLIRKSLSKPTSPAREYSMATRRIASPNRSIASPTRKIASPYRESQKQLEIEHQQMRRSISPMRRTASPGRGYIYSPSKTYVSPSKRRSPARVAEDVYTEKLLSSVKKESQENDSFHG